MINTIYSWIVSIDNIVKGMPSIICYVSLVEKQTSAALRHKLSLGQKVVTTSIVWWHIQLWRASGRVVPSNCRSVAVYVVRSTQYRPRVCGWLEG